MRDLGTKPMGPTVRLAMVLVLACAGASAQRVIVCTTSFSADGVPTRVFAHSVDLGTGAVLPGGERLPGVPVGPLLATADGRGAVITTHPEGVRERFGGPAEIWLTSCLGMAPFRRTGVGELLMPRGWRGFAACAGRVSPADPGYVVVLGWQSEGDEMGQGRVLRAAWGGSKGLVPIPGAGPCAVPGTPVAAVAPPDSARWLKLLDTFSNTLLAVVAGILNVVGRFYKDVVTPIVRKEASGFISRL